MIWPIYPAIVALAVSAGLMFGVRIGRPFRWAGAAGGVLVTAAVVGLAIVLGDAASWSGPVYALVAPITAVLVAAEARRDEPLFLTEPYGRRVLLVLFPRSARVDRQSERTDSRG